MDFCEANCPIGPMLSTNDLAGAGFAVSFPLTPGVSVARVVTETGAVSASFLPQDNERRSAGKRTVRRVAVRVNMRVSKPQYNSSPFGTVTPQGRHRLQRRVTGLPSPLDQEVFLDFALFFLPGGRPRRFGLSPPAGVTSFSHAGGRPRPRLRPAIRRSRLNIASSIWLRSSMSCSRIGRTFI